MSKTQNPGFGEGPAQFFTIEEAKPVLSRSHSAHVWQLRDAKAHFSEVVRRAATEGPQRVTVRGREDVYVISGADYRRLKGDVSGQVLVDALAAAPHDFAIERLPEASPVRDVTL